MARILVVGDPVVHLGEEAFIPDGAVIVEGRSIVEVGTRADLEAKGPFDRVIGSSDHFIMPGFVAGHYHSEAAVGPGVYELLFEIANIYSHVLFTEMGEEDFYHTILLSLMQSMRGGITTTVDAFYGRPGLPNFGLDAALQAYEDLGIRTGLGITLRDQNLYVHEGNEAFLSRLPADLAEEVRNSPMGQRAPRRRGLRGLRQGRRRMGWSRWPHSRPSCSGLDAGLLRRAVPACTPRGLGTREPGS